MAFLPVMASTMDFKLSRLLWASGRTARKSRGAVSVLPGGCPPLPHLSDCPTHTPGPGKGGGREGEHRQEGKPCIKSCERGFLGGSVC